MRRVHLIPFLETIPPDERDPNLAENLRDEWPGILRWMINGCLEWQKNGLKPPAAVREATEEYLQAEDTMSIWLDECCELVPSAFTTSTVLYGSWKAWAERNVNGMTIGVPRARLNYVTTPSPSLGRSTSRGRRRRRLSVGRQLQQQANDEQRHHANRDPGETVDARHDAARRTIALHQC
jgi:phage/plasmid-associated DNA primase